MDNIAALDQEAFEAELRLEEEGWIHCGQTILPGWPFGGATLSKISAVSENYRRPHDVDQPDEHLEFWWISPGNIDKVVRDGKEYWNPSEQVIRMLVK